MIKKNDSNNAVALVQDEMQVVSFDEQDRMDADSVVHIVAPIVHALSLAWEPRSEIVLHNLTKLPKTIEAISGDITGREVGGPPTDLGLRNFSSGWREHLIGYRTETSSGLQMRSSSLFFHGRSGKAVACLCINTDISRLLDAQELLRSMSAVTSIDPALRSDQASGNEVFPATVDELAEGILQQVIAATEVPVDLMKKRHKLDVVRDLRSRGFFMIREGVELAATGLEVGRHTIYNYLNEIEALEE